MTTAGGENTQWPKVWSLCTSVSMTKRTGLSVSFFTPAINRCVSGGLWQVSIITGPSSVNTTLHVEFPSLAA